MFDSVGREDPRPRRRALPLVLSLLVNGAVAASLVWVGSRAVAEPARAEDAVEAYVELLAPAAPVPAGPRAPVTPHAARARAGTPAVTPPDASLSAPALLPAVTPDPLAPVGATDGDGDASADADGGEGEGEPRAGGGATAGGGQGIRVVHWSEVTPRRRVKPQFPEAALQMGLHEGVCVVRIHIDPRGVPTEVVRQGCPKVFEAATVDAAMAWRFTPLLEDGQGVPAQFDLRVNYVAD